MINKFQKQHGLPLNKQNNQFWNSDKGLSTPHPPPPRPPPTPHLRWPQGYAIITKRIISTMIIGSWKLPFFIQIVWKKLQFWNPTWPPSHVVSNQEVENAPGSLFYFQGIFYFSDVNNRKLIVDINSALKHTDTKNAIETVVWLIIKVDRANIRVDRFQV